MQQVRQGARQTSGYSPFVVDAGLLSLGESEKVKRDKRRLRRRGLVEDDFTGLVDNRYDVRQLAG